MPEREPIVCFGGYDYWYSNPGSPVKLAEAAHEMGHRVLWINSIGMNMPKMRRSGFWRRVGLKLRSWARWLKAARPGFHVLTPIVLPLYGNPRLESLNERWLCLQIRLAYRLLGIRDPVALVALPSFGVVATRLKRSALIYYYTDKYDAYSDLKAHEAMRRRDRMLYEQADLILCASRKIQEEHEKDRPGVVYFPHAVDFERFEKVLEADTQMPADLAAIPSPRIGYFGSLTNSNDLEIIRHCAVEAPDLHFVLIGRVMGDYSSLGDLPNVHLLGMKPYEDIPLYGKYFDVGIMTWKMTEWIRHCSPVKTREYLALGFPVVSVPIEELSREFPGLVELAGDGPSFLAAIRRGLDEDSPELRRRRRDRVRGESWQLRFTEMMEALREVRDAP